MTPALQESIHYLSRGAAKKENDPKGVALEYEVIGDEAGPRC
jgi:hypothetical protein